MRAVNRIKRHIWILIFQTYFRSFVRSKRTDFVRSWRSWPQLHKRPEILSLSLSLSRRRDPDGSRYFIVDYYVLCLSVVERLVKRVSRCGSYVRTYRCTCVYTSVMMSAPWLTVTVLSASEEETHYAQSALRAQRCAQTSRNRKKREEREKKNIRQRTVLCRALLTHPFHSRLRALLDTFRWNCT